VISSSTVTTRPPSQSPTQASGATVAVGVAVRVSAALAVALLVAALVGVRLEVAVGVPVAVDVAVGVAVRVSAALAVALLVAALVGVRLEVAVGVPVAVDVAVGVVVPVADAVGEAVSVPVGTGVGGVGVREKGEENSDVLPFMSVLVAVTCGPLSGPSNDQLPSLVETEPSKMRPSSSASEKMSTAQGAQDVPRSGPIPVMVGGWTSSLASLRRAIPAIVLEWMEFPRS